MTDQGGFSVNFMNTTTNKDEYVPGVFIREATFPNGGTIMNISFHAGELIDYVKKNANAKGRLNVKVLKRKAEGKYGETHYMKLDTFVPKEKPAVSEPPKQKASEPAQPNPADDDVPF